jgi:hypothetical protein
MRRREFISLLGGAAAVWPVVARAQQSERMRRIGIILPQAADDREFQAWVAAFLRREQSAHIFPGFSPSLCRKFPYRSRHETSRAVAKAFENS